MAFPYSPNNNILSVITFRYSPISVILRFITILLPFHSSFFSPNSLRIFLRFFSSFSPLFLPHVPYVENCAVVVVGVNRNRIKGGS